MQFQHLCMVKYRISFLIFFQALLVFCSQCHVFYKHTSVPLFAILVLTLLLCSLAGAFLLFQGTTQKINSSLRKKIPFLKSTLFPEFSCQLFSLTHAQEIHPRGSYEFSSNSSITISNILDNTLSLGLIRTTKSLSLDFIKIPVESWFFLS